VAVVEVKEKPTGTFQIGAGFSSVENFIATAQVSQDEFLRMGAVGVALRADLEPAPADPAPVRRALLPRHELDLRLRLLPDRGRLRHLHPRVDRRQRHLRPPAAHLPG